jgi:hypothetical protein
MSSQKSYEDYLTSAQTALATGDLEACKSAWTKLLGRLQPDDNEQITSLLVFADALGRFQGPRARLDALIQALRRAPLASPLAKAVQNRLTPTLATNATADVKSTQSVLRKAFRTYAAEAWQKDYYADRLLDLVESSFAYDPNGFLTLTAEVLRKMPALSATATRAARLFETLGQRFFDAEPAEAFQAAWRELCRSTCPRHDSSFADEALKQTFHTLTTAYFQRDAKVARLHVLKKNNTKREMFRFGKAFPQQDVFDLTASACAQNPREILPQLLDMLGFVSWSETALYAHMADTIHKLACDHFDDAPATCLAALKTLGVDGREDTIRLAASTSFMTRLDQGFRTAPWETFQLVTEAAYKLGTVEDYRFGGLRRDLKIQFEAQATACFALDPKKTLSIIMAQALEDRSSADRHPFLMQHFKALVHTFAAATPTDVGALLADLPTHSFESGVTHAFIKAYTAALGVCAKADLPTALRAALAKLSETKNEPFRVVLAKKIAAYAKASFWKNPESAIKNVIATGQIIDQTMDDHPRSCYSRELADVAHALKKETASFFRASFEKDPARAYKFFVNQYRRKTPWARSYIASELLATFIPAFFTTNPVVAMGAAVDYYKKRDVCPTMLEYRAQDFIAHGLGKTPQEIIAQLGDQDATRCLAAYEAFVATPRAQQSTTNRPRTRKRHQAAAKGLD